MQFNDLQLLTAINQSYDYHLIFQNECEPISSRGIYLTGCFQAMLDEIETNSAIVGGVAIGILVVMVSIMKHQINGIRNFIIIQNS